MVILGLLEIDLNKLFVRSFEPMDINPLCSWVVSENDLKMISGERGNSLTSAILREWISNSEKSLVCTHHDISEPMAFCTLSKRENNGLPSSGVEICHFIVNPNYRNRKIGIFLLDAAIKEASLLGYKNIYGRIEPTNVSALNLVMAFKPNEITYRYEWPLPCFRWFQFKAKN